MVGRCDGQLVFCLFASDVVTSRDCGGVCARRALYGVGDAAHLPLAPSTVWTRARVVGPRLWIGLDELPSAVACRASHCTCDLFTPPHLSLFLPLGRDSIGPDRLRPHVGRLTLC